MTQQEAVRALRAYADGYAGNIRGMCGVAADMLEELDKRVPRWISVEERLPEDDDHYLVWESDNGRAEVAMYYGDGEWLTDDLDNITRSVTHWMPLPQPPEEDEE